MFQNLSNSINVISLVNWYSMRQMLKSPSLNPLFYIFSELYCYFWTYHDNIGQIFQKPRIVTLGAQNLSDLSQTSVNRGPDSRFVLEAIINSLVSKLSQSSIRNIPNRTNPIYPKVSDMNTLIDSL